MPYAIVCVGSSDVDCYHADENGIIFETASSTDGAMLAYHISLPALTNPIGIDFLDSGRLEGLGAFIKGLASIGFDDDSITVSTSTNYDLTLEHKLDHKGGGLTSTTSSTTQIIHLFIDESRPFPETLKDFSAFWQEYIDKATDTAATNLASVDMRYGNNVIYTTK